MRFHHKKLTTNQFDDSVNHFYQLENTLGNISKNNPEYVEALKTCFKHLQEAKEIIDDLQEEHEIYCEEEV